MLGAVRRRLADQSGLTLIELLVTITTATVVMIALFLFQDVVLKQSNATMAAVDATQRARGAVNVLESRLHSACIAENVTPIQPGSTVKKLNFISKYGSGTTLTPELHKISINGGSATDGTLTDATYPLASGTVTSPVFSNTASSTVTLADHIDPSQSSFTYYSYGLAKDSSGNNYMDAAGSPYMILLDGTSSLPDGTRTSSGTTVASGTIPANSPTTLNAVDPSPGMSAADAKIASAVTISLLVKPAGQLGANTSSSQANVPATITSTVVLRLTPVPTEGNLPSVPPCA